MSSGKLYLPLLHHRGMLMAKPEVPHCSELLYPHFTNEETEAQEVQYPAKG